MKIRNIEHPIAPISEIALIPLLTCLNAEAMPNLDKEAIATLILQRLSDPSNHRKLAYSLKAAMPSLPSELVSYRTFMLSDGREEVEFSFGLTTEELVGAIAAIMEARNLLPAKEPASDPKTFDIATLEEKVYLSKEEQAFLDEERKRRQHKAELQAERDRLTKELALLE